MLWVLGVLGAVVLAFAAYVRLAPSDVARWHVALDGGRPADCRVAPGRGEAWLVCDLPGQPAEVLAALDAVALATPRTLRLSGGPDAGRITWVTRSALWGFPDYTTAEARAGAGGTRLMVWARLRFGGDDQGVNAARLTRWHVALGLDQARTEDGPAP